MCALNQALSYKPNVRAAAAARDGYLPLPDVLRLLRFRAHIDEGQDVVERNIQRDGTPRLQLSTGDSLIWTKRLDCQGKIVARGLRPSNGSTPASWKQRTLRITTARIG